MVLRIVEARSRLRLSSRMAVVADSSTRICVVSVSIRVGGVHCPSPSCCEILSRNQ